MFNFHHKMCDLFCRYLDGYRVAMIMESDFQDISDIAARDKIIIRIHKIFWSNLRLKCCQKILTAFGGEIEFVENSETFEWDFE